MQRPCSEEYQGAGELLVRCDNLFSGIVAFKTAEQQQSLITVLNSSPYLGREECSPSPEVRRSIDFKDLEEDRRSASTPTVSSRHGDESTELAGEEEYQDSDFAYVSRIILDTSPDGCLDSSADTAFATLENRHNASFPSDAGRLHRRLLFDTVVEILDRWSYLSTWDAFASVRSFSSPAAANRGAPLLRRVWAELRRRKEEAPADDLNNVTLEAIIKGMKGDHLGGGVWGLRPEIEMYDAALLIERQIFEDVVAEAIGELSDDVAGECHHPAPR